MGEHVISEKAMNAKFWVILTLSVVAGLAIGWLDSRPSWDDTGITVGLILIAGAILGMLSPSRAWLWGVIVGVGVMLLDILLRNSYAASVAILFGFHRSIWRRIAQEGGRFDKRQLKGDLKAQQITRNRGGSRALTLFLLQKPLDASVPR